MDSSVSSIRLAWRDCKECHYKCHGCQTRVQIRVELNYQMGFLCIERRVVWSSMSWRPCYNRTFEI